MPLAIIDIFSHNIKIHKMQPAVKDAVVEFCETLMRTTVVNHRGRRRVIVDSVYASSPIGRSEIRIHSNLEEDLFDFLLSRNFKRSNFDINRVESNDGVDVDFELLPTDKTPRDYQVTLIDYLIAAGKTKVVTLGTGGGKTFVALRALAHLGKRVLITVPGRYVKKWIGDVEGAYVLKKGDLMVLRGSRDLKVALNQGLENKIEAKIIICTSTTVQNFIKDHTTITKKGYPVHPELLCQTLGCGIRLTDECHQFFHLNFLMELYTHAGKSFNLSATLEHGDPFINRMIQVVYPYNSRMQGRAHKKYIDVAALSFNIDNPKLLPHIRRKMYSHTMWEESIMKKVFTLKQYLGFITKLTKLAYIDKRKEGQKMLIFAATKKMCGEIVAEIKLRFPERTVARYVSEDDWEILHNNEIVVTTLGSAGTAVDVEDLRTVLMTVSIDSRQANAQALGRLREMVNYDFETPEFLYIYSPDIEKQLAYHERKFEIFKPLCKTHNSYNSGFTLKTKMR